VPFSGCVLQLVQGLAAVVKSHAHHLILVTCVPNLFGRNGIVKFPSAAKIF
jgi:hypothetical protein